MSQPLSPNEWHRLEPLLDAVLEARPDERDAVVAELSGGDPATRAQLEQLAADYDRTDLLLERPAAERFAELFDTEDKNIGMGSFLESGPGKAVFTGR